MIRLAGAVLAEQQDEWSVGRRYMTLEAIAKTRALSQPDPTKEAAAMLAA